MKFCTSALMALFLLCSCSEPVEEQDITYIDAGVNGETHMFNTFHVDQEDHSEAGENFQLVTVTGSIERETIRLVAITVREYELGLNACWYFAYIYEGIAYERFDNSFQIEVLESTGHRIRGTFSGDLKSPETGEIVHVTNGGFDVFY